MTDFVPDDLCSHKKTKVLWKFKYVIISKSNHYCLQLWHKTCLNTFGFPFVPVFGHIFNLTVFGHTVDSHCLELGWLEFPVESNFYRSPELCCV
jgi:hypothetical protein